jgi:hypothetical protein
MPRAKCSVCRHPDLNTIDDALRTGSATMRELAERSGLSLPALDRHKQKHLISKGRPVKNIGEEIRRLRIMLAKVRKKGDTNAALAISREIRSWMVFEGKTANVIPSGSGNVEELSRSEALSMAKAIIESQLHDPDVRSWLIELTDRMRTTGNVPEAQD